MKPGKPAIQTSHGRRAFLLAVLIVINVLCVAFFVADVVTDFASFGTAEAAHLLVEAVAAVSMGAATLFLIYELRRIMNRSALMEIGLEAARGEMSALIERHFDAWHLSAAEREVALLVLKGFDNEAIAQVRGTAAGTVRAQCAAIYAKAGVDGRSQLMSVFVEELLAEPLIGADHAASGVGPAQPRAPVAG